MAVTKTLFGTMPDGEKVFSYLLDNEKGVSAEILSLGGIIRRLCVAGKDGEPVDIVLGRDTLEDYLKNDGYIGALIGRHANRIRNGRFVINGEVFTASANEGANSLNGGVNGFDSRVWKATITGRKSVPELTLGLLSQDGEEGFPGKMVVTVTYAVHPDNTFSIRFRARADKDTICNLTNKSYFNLAGYDSGRVYDQVLQINSAFYTPNDSECIPNGEILSVAGTPFDFRAPKPIGQDIDSDFPQTRAVGGYDHNYMIAGRGYRKAAAVSCEKTGITMEVFTDRPAMQLYTANALPGGIHKNGSADAGIHGAFCLEAQSVPNAVEYSHYPGPLLEKDELFAAVTDFKFTAG